MEKIGENVKILKVAVTGSLASGKSTVCQFLKEYGAYVIDADSVVHHLISRDSGCIQKIIELLGNQVSVQGQIRRNLVADMVFSDQKKLTQLEKILHPPLFLAIENAYDSVKNSPLYSLFAAEVPLLFEVGFETFFNYTIAVDAKEEECLARFVSKGHTKEDFYRRLSRRLPREEICERADFVIRNEGSLSTLHKEVENIINQLRS